MINRFWALFVVVLLLPASAVAQAKPLVVTEEDVVTRALGVCELDALHQARATAVTAEAAKAKTAPNPEVGYTREQTFEGATAVGEDLVLVEQAIRLSGRPDLLIEAARHRAAAIELQAEIGRRALAADVRRAFYDMLAQQKRADVYGEWLEMMRDVEGELERRVSAGESAPYELQRLRKEIADIEVESARGEAELASRRGVLVSLADISRERAGSLEAAGELLPGRVATDAELVDALGNRPEAAAADARMAAANALDEAASRLWVPTPTISAGYKGVSAGGERGHGFVAGLRLTLPFSTERTAERRAAAALRAEARAERELAMRDLRGRVLGHAARIRRLAAAAREYRESGVKSAEQVIGTARLAYMAGELGILELIDGYRGLVEARLRVVQVEAEARRSEIELNAILDERAGVSSENQR